MFDGANSAILKLKLVIEWATLSGVELLPILLAPLVWLVLVSVYLTISAVDLKIPRSEVLFFSMVGSVGAYINYLSKDTVIVNLVPSFVIAITFLFQLYGLSNESRIKPLRDRSVFLAGTGTAVCFMFASRYLASLS